MVANPPNNGVLPISVIAFELGISILKRFQKWLFPSAVFAIGTGKKRQSELEKRRNLVLASLILAVITGVISNIIFAQIVR